MKGLEVTVTEKVVDMKRIYQGGDDIQDIGVTVRSAPAYDQAPGMKTGPRAVPLEEAKWITRRKIEIALTSEPKRNTISYKLWVTISNNTLEEDWKVLEFIREILGYGHIGDVGKRKILVIPKGYSGLFLEMVSKYVNRPDVNMARKFLAEKRKDFDLNSMDQRHFEILYKDILIEEKE